MALSGRSEWINPNAQKSAPIVSANAARRARPSMTATAKAAQTIDVRMKPLPRTMIVKRSERPCAVSAHSAAKRSGGSSAGSVSLIATMRAMAGKKLKTTAAAYLGGVATKACTVMLIAT